MLTTELCARLCADFPLQLPDAPACFTCTRVVLDPWDDAEGGTVFIGEGTVDRPDRFYLLCAPGAPQHPNAAHYADPALTLPLACWSRSGGSGAACTVWSRPASPAA